MKFIEVPFTGTYDYKPEDEALRIINGDEELVFESTALIDVESISHILEGDNDTCTIVLKVGDTLVINLPLEELKRLL